MAENGSKCNEPICGDKTSARCTECLGCYHLGCSGVKTAAAWRKRGKKSKWLCDACMLESASSVSGSDSQSTDNIMAILKRVREDMTKDMRETRQRYGLSLE
jgi:hypothetical protein